MTAITAPKSRLPNWLEGVTLTTLLRGMPIYANAALMLRLIDHRMVGDGHGVVTFVVLAVLAYALTAPLLSGPRCPRFLKRHYERLFFDPTLPFVEKVAQWRAQPGVSVQLLATVIIMSVLAVAVLSRS